MAECPIPNSVGNGPKEPFIIQGKAPKKTGSQWPTGAELRELVNEIHQRRTRPKTEPKANWDQETPPSMAERAQADMEQFVSKGETEMAHHTRGLKLVAGKNLNMQKLAGEQDKSNKVHYAKYHRL